MILHGHSDRKALGGQRTPENWCQVCKTWMLPATPQDRPEVDYKTKGANDHAD